MSEIVNKTVTEILIIGAGPAGLGAALAYHNSGFKDIIVIEGRNDLNFNLDDSYPIGLNVRGQNSLKKLFNNSPKTPSNDEIGLRIDQMKIIVGPGINVANFDSGLLIGSTRNGITIMLYEEVLRRGGIKVNFGQKAVDVDLKRRTIKCISPNGIQEYHPKCVIIADGFKSKVRDSLVEQDTSLRVQQWPWKMSFRVLFSDKEPKTDLNPYIHYIHNRTYYAKLTDGRWTVCMSISEETPKFISSDNDSEENVNELHKYLKKLAPPAAELITHDEFKRFFKRRIFQGAVTKVSKLVVDNWAVLIGDAAHSPIPASGEGINSALEDCCVLQDCMINAKSIEECLVAFENKRLEDVHALTAIAYSAAFGGFKNAFQMSVLSMLKKIGLVGPSKEDLLFGKDSANVKRYSEAFKIWKEQTALLFGPTLPPK